MLKKITIVGAGPAGSSLAIRLALKGFDVTLIEREKFPRQKLCGEFISPECLDHFAELGVLEQMKASGGDRIFETSFYSPVGRSVTVPSLYIGGSSALSLSRAEMDLKLLRRAEAVGVRVFESAYANEIVMKDRSVAGLSFRDSEGRTVSIQTDILVDATGRAAVLTRLLGKHISGLRQKSEQKPAYVGFKNHMTGVDLPKGRCEIYFFDGGYIGISNIENGYVNACFLVESRLVREFKSGADEIVRTLVLGNSRARETMARYVPAREWLAVPLGSYGRKTLDPAPGLFCVGDSAAFIDPFTGSGMLLALESSDLLSQAITAHPASYAEIAARYVREHRAQFGSRLGTASLLRRAAFSPRLTAAAIRMAGVSVRLTELLARLTRRRPAAAVSRR